NNSLCQCDNTNTNLAKLDDDLDLLLGEQTSPMDLAVSSLSDPIHLIIILDISTSMKGTEGDIYNGLKELIAKHRHNNILFTMALFNGEGHLAYDKTYIGDVEIPRFMMEGSTNLNGTLYYTLRNRCKSGTNLGVVISDGEDVVSEVSTNKVQKMMSEFNNPHNYLYFLGEPNERQTPEEVLSSAIRLGFKESNISIFTRKGNGNRINFEVISRMLSELLEYGTISDDWSAPIKEHYLALTDGRRL
ncbi:MAG: hypothetical protein K2J20_06520, partial [Bacilli bacterium]|nr:hypothetical protein [Bacilli bacterium]